MPKVTEQYREAKREEIAHAAMRSFAKKGFTASMADIIAESGLSAGAIYGHFASKNDVMVAVAGLIMGSRIEEMQNLRSRDRVPAPGEVFTRILTELSRDISDTGLLLQVWGEAVVDEGISAVVLTVFSDLSNAYCDLFSAWVMQERGLDEAAARFWAKNLVPIALGLGQGYIAQSALFPDFDRVAYLAAARELLPH